MKRKIIYSIASAFVLAIVLFACRKEIVDILVESIKFSPEMTTATLDMSSSTTNTKTLIATIEPKDAFNQLVRWTSLNTAIATVESLDFTDVDDGRVSAKITARSPGTTTIIVTTDDGGFTATCQVTVIKQATRLTLNKRTLALVEGNKEMLIATPTPADATNLTITWSSNSPTVASVDNIGNVTAISAGTTGTATAVIRAAAQDGTIYDDCVVTVTKATTPVEGITLNHTDVTLPKGSTPLALRATIWPANATNQTVTWSISPAGVASIAGTGSTINVTPVAEGTATVTATTADGNKVATCIIRVTVPVEDIFVTPPILNFTLGVNADTTLTASFNPTNPTNKGVIWTSSNRLVATVTDKGVVHPVAIGEAIIIATSVDGGKTAFCHVTVIAQNTPVADVGLSPATLSFSGAETKQLTANILPLSATNKKVRWEIDDASVATLSVNTAFTDLLVIDVTSKDVGTATITVTTQDGNKIATRDITVTEAVVSSVALDITDWEFDDDDDDPIKLTATILPDKLFDKSVTWSSSAPTIAKVSGNGIVTPLSVGTATITATSVADPTKKATCTVEVKN